MFHQIFFSPKVKWSVIISNKHGIYELLHELSNNLRVSLLGSLKKVRKTWKTYKLIPSLSAKIIFFNTSQKLVEKRNWTFPVWHYFAWKLEFVSNILWIIVVFSNFLLVLAIFSFWVKDWRIFHFNYSINRMQKLVSKKLEQKVTKKPPKKTRQSSKTVISDFKLEYAKMFLMKFCWDDSIFRWKF